MGRTDTKLLFVVDQVAGAEYIYPVLRDLPDNRGFLIYAAAPSAGFLTRHGVPFRQIDNPSMELARTLLAEVRPVKVVMSASLNSTLEVVFRKAAKSSNIEVIQFIDNWLNYSERFADNREGEFPDRILTLDNHAKAVMVEEGIPENIIEIIGQPYFEMVFQDLSRHPQVQLQNRALLLTQPVSKYYGKSLGYDENDFIQMCIDTLHGVEMGMTICVHPDEKEETYLKLIGDNAVDVEIVRNVDFRRARYEVVAGMFSSMMLYSLLGGMKTVSVQPARKGRQMSDLVNRGLIRCCESEMELTAFFSDRCSNEGGGDALPIVESVKGSCQRFERIIKESL